MPDAALEGIAVLDLTHHIAGPYCTKLLADFGAEVIKIEPPGPGDPARSTGPFFHDEDHPEKSLPFLYLNTNKRSVTLNLKSDGGRDLLKRLVLESDVLVENFRPRVLPSLGLGYNDLRQINPRLVMVSISNFGQTGPYRDYEATEIVEYAMGGLMYIFGSNQREPLKHALHQAQFKAGTNAAAAAGIAVYHQQLAGQGQWLDISIQECIAAALRDTTSLYTYTGAVKGRQSEHTGDIPPSPVKAKDGYIVPIAFGDVDWKTVADFLGAPELGEDRFSTAEGRLENAEELHRIVRECTKKRNKLEMFYAAHQRRGLLYGVVQSPEEVVENPQYRERGYFVEIEHPLVGEATYPGAPFQMSETPWNVLSPAPTLGQHTAEILRERLGYSDEELARLRESGVV